MKHRSVRLLVSTLLIVFVCSIGLSTQHAHAQAALSTISGLHVSGNQLQNANGENVRLLGVNRSGTEYKCVNNAGIFDGPNDEASVDAMASWHINAVRVPLNEDCWLWLNGAQSSPDAGTPYQQAIIDYVNLLNSKGLIAILDLHWNAPGTDTAFGQQPMPDADHAYDFWYSVASTFKDNSSVIFNLYNEPHADSDGGDCWLNGSSAPNAAPCSSVNFAVAGMQSLVDKVRQTGANNVIMLDGWGYANYIGGVLASLPSDPDNNLMISAHVYSNSGCATTDCFNQQYLPVAQQLPVVFGEIGEYDCQHSFIDGVMDWADQNNVGYLGWAWDANDCSSFPSLISDYNGTPTAFGIGFRDHLAAL
jgi:endoglucanase